MKSNIEKRMDAYKEYRETSQSIVEWLIGLSLGQITLVVSMVLDQPKILFILVLSSFVVSIIIGLIIMYSKITWTDSVMYSAQLRQKHENLNPDEFAKKISKRMGWFGEFSLNIAMKHKIYQYLFLSFSIGTVFTVLLVLLKI